MSQEVNTPCPSTSFARSLKIYDDVSFGKKNETRRMVVDFDYASYFENCSITSDHYNEDKCDFDKITAELFKPGETWKSRDLVQSVLNVIEQKHGWTSTLEKLEIRCNRFGSDVRTPRRDFTSGSLKAGCTFTINLKPLVKTPYFPESQKGKDRPIPSYKPEWDQPVEIGNGTCTTHAGNCHPGRQNRVVTMSRAGAYVEKMPDAALFQLCNVYELCGKISSAMIKSVMTPVWPSSKIVSKQDVFNIRVKVHRLMPTFRSSNKDYDAFKQIVNSSNFLQGIENEELNDDEAYQLGHSAWLICINFWQTSLERVHLTVLYPTSTLSLGMGSLINK